MKRIISSVSMIVSYFVLTATAFAQTGLGTFDAEGIGGYTPNLTDTDVDGASSQLASIFSNAIGFMTIVASIFFIFHFITGAFNWITSGGDQQKLEQARTKMTNGAIGMTIVIASYAIGFIIGQVLGFDIMQLGLQVAKLGPGN